MDGYIHFFVAYNHWGAPKGAQIQIPAIEIHSWKLLVVRKVHMMRVNI